jgi:DNA-binding FadR family transcriptional regulator
LARTGQRSAPAGSSRFVEIPRPRQVAVEIGEAILSAIRAGTFPVGSRLPGELELARQFGVSRPSVREALAALQFAGYVDSRRGASKVVVSTDGQGAARSPGRLGSADDVLDLFEARIALEPAAMALAALDPDPGALAVVTGVVAGMRLAVEEPVFHASTDLRMHAALAAVCRNRLLGHEVMRLVRLSAHPALAAARERAWASPELPRLWAGQHVAIWEAVRAGDADSAERVACEHLCSTIVNVAEAGALPPRGARMEALLARAGAGRRSEGRAA